MELDVSGAWWKQTADGLSFKQCAIIQFYATVSWIQWLPWLIAPHSYRNYSHHQSTLVGWLLMWAQKMDLNNILNSKGQGVCKKNWNSQHTFFSAKMITVKEKKSYKNLQQNVFKHASAYKKHLTEDTCLRCFSAPSCWRCWTCFYRRASRIRNWWFSQWILNIRTSSIFFEHFNHGRVSLPPPFQPKAIKVFTDRCLLKILLSRLKRNVLYHQRYDCDHFTEKLSAKKKK